MDKLPTVKSILNTPSIFDGYTFEDMVTFGRVSAEQATSTCMKYAQVEYMKNSGWSDILNIPSLLEEFTLEDIVMANIKRFLKEWSQLESQVRRKFKEAEEIASVL